MLPRRSVRTPKPNSKYSAEIYEVAMAEKQGNDISVEELAENSNSVSDIHTDEDAILLNTSDNSDLRKEMEELELELEKQRKIAERRELQEKLRRMKGELVAVRESNRIPTGETPPHASAASGSSSRHFINKSSKNITIKEVRGNGKTAQNIVNKALSESGVNILDSDSAEEEPQGKHGKPYSYDDYLQFLETTNSKKRHSKKRGSDILWPNEFVSFQHTQSLAHVEYEALDSRLFAIGELEVCLRGGLAQEVANLRLDWLSEVLGYASHYDWKAILRLHAQVLHLTSIGRLSWGDEFAFSKLVSQFIFPHLIHKKSKAPATLPDRNKITKSKPKAEKYWCKNFNSTAGCPHEDGHKITFFDEITVMNHFCSMCYSKDHAIRNHSAKSIECPHKN